MKTMIRTTLMAALILGMATKAFAKEEYKKEDDSSIVLTLDNGVATITKIHSSKEVEVLAQGAISYGTNSDDPSSQDFLISQPEYVVCPPQIWAQTITDIVKGASRSAIKLEALFGTASVHRQCKNPGIDGIYEFSK